MGRKKIVKGGVGDGLTSTDQPDNKPKGVLRKSKYGLIQQPQEPSSNPENFTEEELTEDLTRRNTEANTSYIPPPVNQSDIIYGVPYVAPEDKINNQYTTNILNNKTDTFIYLSKKYVEGDDTEERKDKFLSNIKRYIELIGTSDILHLQTLITLLEELVKSNAKYDKIKNLLLERQKQLGEQQEGGKRKPLTSCTVAELKVKAKKRGIKVTGLKKAEIIAKLRRR